MGNILDANNHKLAIIHDDGTIWSVAGIKLGYLNANDIYDKDGDKAGYLGTNDYVFNSLGNHIGTVRSNGDVYDIENHRVGKTIGNHMQLGGAALLLIVR